MIDFQEINQAALARLPELLLEQFPSGRIQGNEFICGDLAGNPGSSFKANLATCQWSDFAHPGVSGRDPVSLFAAALNVSQGEAAKYLADRMGTTTKKTATKKAKPVDPLKPAPTDTPPESINHPRLGKPSATWVYPDQDGKLRMIDCRFDLPDGEKEVLPYSHWRDSSTRKTYWRWKAIPAPRPLYGLDRLAAHPDAPVLFAEGCKATDAAQRLLPGVVCLTWPGGSGAVDKADFGPIAGRRVAIWPDADEPGRKAADNVARHCLDAGAAEVFVIELPPGKVDGWDLADAEAEGWTPSQVSEWIINHKAIVASQTPVTDARRFRFVSAGELVSRPADWLIHGYLEVDSVVGIFGPPACMKTFMAIDMGLCISAGIPWHGCPVKQQGPVFYICGEGKSGIRKRITGWERHHGTTAEKFFVSTGPAQLLDPGSLADVEAAADEIAAKHGKPALIIIDTLNRNFGPGDENSTSDMTMFVQALDRLRNRLQCAVMIVHHTGLGDSGRGRGSSALRGALDFEYLCEKTGTEIDEIQITLTNTKTKDHEPPQTKTFRPSLVDLGLVDDDLRPISSIVLEPTEPTRKKVRLSLPCQIALDSLRALGVHGELVSENSWRTECYARGIATTDTPDAKRKSFLRARTYLLAQNIVATRDDQYWIQSDFSETGHRDRPGQTGTCPAVSRLGDRDKRDTPLRGVPSVPPKDTKNAMDDDGAKKDECPASFLPGEEKITPDFIAADGREVFIV